MSETMNQTSQMSQMSQAQLLHFIDVVCFQAAEASLYLDTHPKDAEALQYFNYFMDLRNQAMKVYAEKYTPLTLDTANPCSVWDWATTPWPWEGGNC